MNVPAWLRRIGVVLILFGVAWIGGWTWWAESRILDPLDMPLPLATGHIQTPEFAVNVESCYAGVRRQNQDAAVGSHAR